MNLRLRRRRCAVVSLPRSARAFVFMALLAVGPPIAAASPVRLDMRGGAGGSYFEYLCEPGHVLVGLRAYAGLWLDNVQAVCVRSVATGLADAEPVGPVFGGADARTTTGYMCPDATVGSGFSVRETAGRQVLGELHLACKDVFTFGAVPADPAGNLRGTGMQKLAGSELLQCPSDLVAIGIRGRAGTYLDAFGLLCGPLPVAVQAKSLGKRDRSAAVLEATPAAGPSPFGEQVAAPDVVAARTGTMANVSGAAQSTRKPCRAGFVWRLARAADAVCVTPASRSDIVNENGSAVERWDPTGAYGAKTCAAGYVWREAFEGDAVCVPPARRAAVRLENDQAASRTAGP